MSGSPPRSPRPATSETCSLSRRNGGASWSRPSPAPARRRGRGGRRALYTGSVRGQGLYVSQDGGRAWTGTDPESSPATCATAWSRSVLPGGGAGRRLLVLNTPIDGGADAIYRSDGGKDWVKAPLQRPVQVADAGGSTVLAVDPRRASSGVRTAAIAGRSWPRRRGNPGPSGPT